MRKFTLLLCILVFAIPTKSQQNEEFSNPVFDRPAACELNTGSGCHVLEKNSPELVTSSAILPHKISELFNWKKHFLGKNLREAIQEYVDPKKGHIVTAILERPISHINFNQIIIQDLNDFKKDEMIHYMKRKIYTFMTPDRSIIVYYEKEDKTWYLQRFNATAVSNNLIVGERIPIAKCLSTVGSEEGYVSSAFKVTVRTGANGEVSADIINPITNNVLISIAGQLAVGEAVKLSGAVTCSFEKGRYAQPFLHPFYIHVPEGERVSVAFVKKTGLLITGEWQKTKPGARVAAVAPLVECSSGNTSSVCHTGTQEGLHIAEIARLFNKS